MQIRRRHVLVSAPMLGSDILDVTIGVVFVFFIVSILCSAIREGIEAWMKSRATHLEQGIRELLHDRDAVGLARQFFEHPMIYGLYAGGYEKSPTSTWWPTALTRGRNLPSYIPSRNFALALMDMAARGPVVDQATSSPISGAITFDDLRANIATIGNPPVQRALLSAIDTAQGDLQKAQKNIEDWYDSAMDRVSGWYKRSTQWILFAIGLSAAVVFNVNTLTVVDYLYSEKAARQALVARAQVVAADPASPSATYNLARHELESNNLPIGWGNRAAKVAERTQGRWDVLVMTTLGWLLTAIAASLGAPFWFDLLNKMMVIRSTVKPHEKSPEEASEDRQVGSAPPPAAAAGSPAAPPAPPGAAVATTAAAAPSPPPPPAAPVPPDQIDGCDVGIVHITSDEDLPAAEGGVA